MIDRYCKEENYDNMQTGNQAVVVLNLEGRQVSEIYLGSNKFLSEQKDDTQNSKEFKFLEPIINLINLGINTRIIVMFKSYSHYNDQIRCLIQSYLKTSCDVGCEFATSSGDLWHLLAKNIQNLDIIHIFSSEPQRVPDSVLKYLYDKSAFNNLKIIKTGSSMQDYSRVVAQISSKIVIYLSKNEQLKAKDTNGYSSKSTAIEIKCEEVSKIVDQSKSKTLFYFDQNLSYQIYLIYQ